MSCYDKNLEAVRNADEVLYQAIRNMGDIDYTGMSCGIENARNGSPIVYVIKDERKYYLNSCYNPEREAEKFVQKYEDVVDHAFMCFMGISNGMIAIELLHTLPKHIQLYFYEPSIDIFMLLFNNIDLTELFNSSRVRIIIAGMNDGALDVQIAKKLDVTTYMISRCEVLPMYNQIFPDETAMLQQIFHFQSSTEGNNVATSATFGKSLAYNEIYNMRSMLNCNCEEEFVGVFPTDRPVIIVSAGPSLEKNAHLLKEAKGYMLIIAVDTAMPYLAKHNIRPDMVIVVDAFKPVSLFEDELTKEIPWVTSTDANYEILEMTDNKVIFACSNSDYHNKLFNLGGRSIGQLSGGGCVASYALALVVSWGYKQIVLVGQDFAIEPDKVHAGGLAMSNERLEEEWIPVEGYYGDTVYTLRDYNYYRQWFESTMRINKGKLEMINATEGGAKIQGTVQMPLSEVLRLYKKEPFDFEKTIWDMPPVIQESQREEVINIWHESCDTIEYLRNNLSIAMNLSKRGFTTMKSGNYTKDNIFNIFNQLCSAIDKCDDKIEIVFLDKMTEAEHAGILEDIYIAEDATDDEICRMFEKMTEYVTALYDSIDEVKGMFEKIIADVS